MLDRNLIRQNPELVRLGASHKRVDAPIDEFLAVDGELRTLKLEVEEKRAESNRISKTIGQLMAQGKKEEAETAKIQAKAMSDAVSEQEPRERELEARLRELEFEMPNLAQDSVPVGYSEAENVHVRESGEKLKYDFEPKAHWDIAESLGLLDFERAAKISGSGFALYTGWGARLQRALFNFMIDHQSMNNGYREIYPPYVVNRESLMATGQLPKFEEDLFKVGPDHFLIPTAEVPVTNLYRDEILNPEDLTLKMAAFSGCFRREAGAAGKDTRGIQRMHQFDKVELVKMCKPEDSSLELESLVADAEQILQILGLHYRVALLCTGEMSFSNAKCYDLEVWCPGVGRYLEVSSCSNFLDFQARRAGIRFRREAGAKPEFVHILNGSGVATPRLFAAIVETFQQPDGSVIIPTELRPYVGTDRISTN